MPASSQALLAAVAALSLSTASARAEDQEAARYQRCILQVAHNAQAALEAARAWITDGGGGPAQHCQALALLSLGHPKEAAELLDRLASATSDDKLRADMLDQAGNAWILAGDSKRALADFSAAIEISANRILPAATTAAYYADRARAHVLQKNRAGALDDLNRSLALFATPGALTLRARIKREVNDSKAAAADIERALKLAPDFAEAFLERGRLRWRTGDIARAREDFVKAALLQKDGPIAEQARDELSSLDVKVAD